jgi:steroid delta-isomerase-like uncharacterized protein
MSEENKALSRRWAEELFSQGNLDLAGEIFAPDHVNHDPNVPMEASGPEGMKRLFGMYKSAFPDGRLTIEDQIAEGDKVVSRWSASGTHQGEMMGIAPSDNRVEMKGITIDRFAEGKIAESWNNYDLLGLMQQIGALPSPEEPQG